MRDPLDGTSFAEMMGDLDGRTMDDNIVQVGRAGRVRPTWGLSDKMFVIENEPDAPELPRAAGASIACVAADCCHFRNGLLSFRSYNDWEIGPL